MFSIRRSVQLLASLLLLGSPLLGGTFAVSIDTSTYFGQTGAIYFQFSPGLNSDPASVQINSFVVTPGLLISGTPTGGFPAGANGDVTGTLDSLPLVMGNTTALNDYLQYLTFGHSLLFDVGFSIPAVLSGNAGSSLLFQLTAADGLSPILTQDPGGFIGRIDYNELGVFAALPLSDAVTITSGPEPSAFLLFGSGLVLCAFRLRRIRSV